MLRNGRSTSSRADAQLVQRKREPDPFQHLHRRRQLFQHPRGTASDLATGRCGTPPAGAASSPRSHARPSISSLTFAMNGRSPASTPSCQGGSRVERREPRRRRRAETGQARRGQCPVGVEHDAAGRPGQDAVQVQRSLPTECADSQKCAIVCSAEAADREPPRPAWRTPSDSAASVSVRAASRGIARRAAGPRRARCARIPARRPKSRPQ